MSSPTALRVLKHHVLCGKTHAGQRRIVRRWSLPVQWQLQGGSGCLHSLNSANDFPLVVGYIPSCAMHLHVPAFCQMINLSRRETNMTARLLRHCASFSNSIGSVYASASRHLAWSKDAHTPFCICIVAAVLVRTG